MSFEEYIMLRDTVLDFMTWFKMSHILVLRVE